MRLLLRFSLPMLVGNIFQQFYSMVDAMIVGRFVGVDALAAVGATGGMSFLVLGFVIGLANGFCVVVSQRFGARDEAGLRRCVAMTMLLSLIVTAVATAASFLGTEPMLRAMNTPENIFSDSAAYIGIIFLGLRREPVLQSVLRPAARRGRQQNAVVFPVPLQRAERRAGPSVRCDVLHGRGGRRLGHHPFSGRFGAAVPGLYAEKIPHPAHRPGRLGLATARWCAALPGWAFPRRCPTA